MTTLSGVPPMCSKDPARVAQPGFHALVGDHLGVHEFAAR
jgi:hypothetical protein